MDWTWIVGGLVALFLLRSFVLSAWPDSQIAITLCDIWPESWSDDDNCSDGDGGGD
ncbi:MAG: hypothetical protein AAFR45_02835 [Pseudomonadota bacterium]